MIGIYSPHILQSHLAVNPTVHRDTKEQGWYSDEWLEAYDGLKLMDAVISPMPGVWRVERYMLLKASSEFPKH